MIGISSNYCWSYPTTDGASGLPSVTYEAEDATLNGAVFANTNTGYTGTGYADYTNASGDYIEWTVNAAAAGSYQLQFRYALNTGNRPLQIKVNGVTVVSSLSFPATGSWTNWSTVSTTQTLNSGANTVCATAISSSGANIDNLQVIHISSPPVSGNTCHDVITKTFEYQGEIFNAYLAYFAPNLNYFEAFFTIQDPDVKAYTVYPPAGPYENQTYYYLQVLDSVANYQTWIWDYPESPYECTKNGVTVHNEDPVLGVEEISVPSLP